MERSAINYAVNFLMIISFLFTVIIGLILFFFFHSGIQQGSYQTFLGILKENWSFFHVWSGIIFIILAILHFILHWDWVVCMTKNIFSKKNKKLKGGKRL